MVVRPTTEEQFDSCRKLIAWGAGVGSSADQQFLVWLKGEDPKIVVCLNGFVGKICQMHVAMAPGYKFTPRAMLRATFEYAFIERNLQKVVAIVNANNVEAMRYDTHLGFAETLRWCGMHDDDGDMVVLEMDKASCKWITLEGE